MDVVVEWLCCVESDLAARDRVRVGFSSDGAGEFGERLRDAPMDARVDSEFVVPSTHVLHERMAADDHACSVVAFWAAHWAESRFQSAVIGFDPIVRIPLNVVERGGHELLNHSP
jgi:hypothetical protein